VTADPQRVRALITRFLEGASKPVPDELSDELALYGGGLELDSLEAAELSAHLEDEFGTDPFSAALESGDDMPETVGDIVGFYGVTSGK
jgi:acyl carrier protein